MKKGNRTKCQCGRPLEDKVWWTGEDWLCNVCWRRRMITLYTDVSRNYAQRAATLQEEIDRILQNENKEEPRVEAVRRDVARMMRGIKDGKVKTKPYKRKI